MDQLPTIAGAQAEMRGCRLTPSDIVEHCLGRIEAFDHQIRAWVLVDAEGARREAERLTRLAERGEFVGPLHGIPLGIKDIIDVAGMPTKCGSPLRAATPPAVKDASVVAMLRRAGAIILGKTVTTEWACFDPPPTRNPWNLNHTPGGSSSGSAAAVAMEMCMAALGTQTGGSIIRPAAYCGVVGYKPAFGRVSRDGVALLSERLDHVGFMVRSLDGSHALWNALADEKRGSDTFEKSATVIGVPDGFFWDEAATSVADAARDMLEQYNETNKWIAPLTLPPSFKHVHQMHYRIMAYEAAMVHGSKFKANSDCYGSRVGQLIDVGLGTPFDEYREACQCQETFRREIDALLGDLDGVNVLAMPATDVTAPPRLDTTGDAKFQSPWSFAGLPEVTVPIGLIDGMPCGLQLIGRRNEHWRIAMTGGWMQMQWGMNARPPLAT